MRIVTLTVSVCTKEEINNFWDSLMLIVIVVSKEHLVYINDEGTCYIHDRSRRVKERERSKCYNCNKSETAVC